MKKLILLFIIAGFIFGCAEKADELSPQERTLQREAIVQVINNYVEAYQNKNFSKAVRSLSDTVVFYGTDIEEKITSLSQFKEEVQAEWDLVSKIEYGQMRDLLIYIDNDAELAQVYYALPARYHFKEIEEPRSLYLRYARTLKKIEGNWLIVGGTAGAISSSQTAEAMLEKLIGEKKTEDEEK